jgi:hypothetical protein
MQQTKIKQNVNITNTAYNGNFIIMRKRYWNYQYVNATKKENSTETTEAFIIITTTILNIIHRPAFYLKLNSTQLYRFVRTSQETHYVSATSPTG